MLISRGMERSKRQSLSRTVRKLSRAGRNCMYRSNGASNQAHAVYSKVSTEYDMMLPTTIMIQVTPWKSYDQSFAFQNATEVDCAESD